MAQVETCHNCVYSYWDRNLAAWTLSLGIPVRPTCANQADYPGRMRACPLGTICRNFRPRPPTPTGPTVKTIPLGDGFHTYVDAADFEWLNQWTWYVQDGYAIRREKRKYVYMHRQIMQPPEGMVVDHRNLNKLDNTRVNLRVCTQQENLCNRRKKRGTFSRFRGVSYPKGGPKYLAQVYYKGKTFFCGYHTDEVEAARARDYTAVQVLGEEARLNLPEEWPPERVKRVHAEWLRAQARLKARAPRTKDGGSKHKKRKSPITNRKSKALRAQARQAAEAPRPKSKGSKHKNRKSQIVNHKSKAPRAQAPKGPARKKKKATGKRKQTRRRE
jgi:hypothetical protein